jgi:hypothetical protein
LDIIIAVEEELSLADSSIETELNKIISNYQNQLENANDSTALQKLYELIDVVNYLLDITVQYNSSNQFSGSYDQSVSTQSLPGSPVALYELDIAAVVAWFNLHGYYLSSELLLHAKANTVNGSTYSPVNKNIILASSVTQGIMQTFLTTSQPNGSSSYNSGDLYYAIHLFDWHRGSGNKLIITDTYDYALDNNVEYSDIEGAAINSMYYAQLTGVLVPYYLEVYVN